MLKELTGISFDDQVWLMAISIIEMKVKALAPEDRDDLFEVIREFMTTTDPESREAAGRAIAEIIEPVKTRVRRVPLPAEDDTAVTPWTDYISARIRQLRCEAGLTQEDLAERSGLTQSHICQLERGKHSPNGLTLEKLAKGLGVPVSKLDPSASENE